jgi:hypothetical protein
MNPAIAAILVFIGVAMGFQFVGFLISQSVDYFVPAAGLLTFLVLFIGSMFGAWPVAVWLTERFVPGAKPVPALATVRR